MEEYYSKEFEYLTNEHIKWLYKNVTNEYQIFHRRRSYDESSVLIFFTENTDATAFKLRFAE